MLLLITNQILGVGLSNEASKMLVDTVRKNATNHPTAIKTTIPETSLKHEYLKCSELNNGSFNTSVQGVGTAFAVSSLLAIMGHTTNVLVRLGITVSNLIKYGLDAISLTLGTITAAGCLSEEDKDTNNQQL